MAKISSGSSSSSSSSSSSDKYGNMTVEQLLEALQPFLNTPEEEEDEKVIKDLLKLLGYKGDFTIK